MKKIKRILNVIAIIILVLAIAISALLSYGMFTGTGPLTGRIIIGIVFFLVGCVLCVPLIFAWKKLRSSANEQKGKNSIIKSFKLFVVKYFKPFVNNIIKKFKPKEKSVELQWRETNQTWEDDPEYLPARSRTHNLAIEPLDDYSLTYHYEDVEISSWDWIPSDIKVGNRVAFIQEPTNQADDRAVLLAFIPQRRKFGYLYRGRLQDMVNDYINRGDKVLARLSYLQFQPYKSVRIDMAFYRKVKSKKKTK